ncbi:hypothetical protein [Intrasporangium sp.]|uniref:hypothetical protein n=1 Tax=Intrasporangium sp. TaxID=1925024 RepID=UPI003365AC77
MSEHSDPTVPTPMERTADSGPGVGSGGVTPVTAGPPAPTASAAPPGGNPWRAAAAAILLVLGVILVPVTAVSWWVRGTLTDTDKYVAAVGPLASDPQVQAAVTDQVTDRVMTRIQSLNLAQEATDALIARGVPPQIAAAASLIASPIREQTTNLVHRVVGEVVSSEAFATVWTDANRVVHTQLLRLLNGETSALQQNESGQLVLNLSAISGPLRTQLVAAGVPGADKIPDINAQVVVGDGTRIERAQDAYRLVKGIPVLLLILTILLLGLGIFFSRRRLRATLFTLAGIVVAMLIALTAARVGQDFAVDNLRQDVRGAAQAMVTIVTDRLRTILRVVAWVALIALVVALVSGNGARATALRRQVRQTSEVAWGRAMGWQHTFVVSIAATIVAVVVLLATDLPVFWNLLLVIVAVLAGITAWFSSRPDEARATPSLEPAPSVTETLPATGSTDGAQAPAT